jgi:hypothetical protein
MHHRARLQWRAIRFIRLAGLVQRELSQVSLNALAIAGERLDHAHILRGFNPYSLVRTRLEFDAAGIGLDRRRHQRFEQAHIMLVADSWQPAFLDVFDDRRVGKSIHFASETREW